MKRTLLALALLTALPLSAGAADLSYSYIEGGYTNYDESGSFDADGWRLGGSAALGTSFHVFGSYDDIDVDGFDANLDQWRLGLGWNTGITDNTDLVVRAAYAELDGPGGSVDGWESEVGLRSALSANFETYVALGYADGDFSDGDVYGRLGAQYKFNPTWGIAADATFIDGENQYFIGPRISF